MLWIKLLLKQIVTPIVISCFYAKEEYIFLPCDFLWNSLNRPVADLKEPCRCPALGWRSRDTSWRSVSQGDVRRWPTKRQNFISNPGRAHSQNPADCRLQVRHCMLHSMVRLSQTPGENLWEKWREMLAHFPGSAAPVYFWIYVPPFILWDHCV